MIPFHSGLFVNEPTGALFTYALLDPDVLAYISFVFVGVFSYFCVALLGAS